MIESSVLSLAPASMRGIPLLSASAMLRFCTLFVLEECTKMKMPNDEGQEPALPQKFRLHEDLKKTLGKDVGVSGENRK